MRLHLSNVAAGPAWDPPVGDTSTPRWRRAGCLSSSRAEERDAARAGSAAACRRRPGARRRTPWCWGGPPSHAAPEGEGHGTGRQGKGRRHHGARSASLPPAVEDGYEASGHHFTSCCAWEEGEIKGILPDQLNRMETLGVARGVPRNGGDVSGRFGLTRGLPFD